MKYNVAAALFVTLAVLEAAFAADRPVHGRVMSADGEPVEGVDIAAHWGANGPPHDRNGKPYDLTTEEGQNGFWGNVGQMFPLSRSAVKSGSEGQFTINVPEDRHYLMAIDADRKNGALITRTDDDRGSHEIRLAPLVRIKADLEGPDVGQRLGWSHVWLLTPDEPTRPLDFPRIGSCGSLEARMEFSLPPGRYFIDASWVTDDDEKLELLPMREIILKGDIAEVDLGVLRVARSGPTLSAKISQSKAEGTWSDYTEHFGEKPPPWNVVDARGVGKEMRLSDLQGKWVLLDFWGPSCLPCLRTGMPKLIKFYEDHQYQRDRFEILAICIDPDGRLQTIEQLDKTLKPIVEHVWKKPLPFPVLLDPTFKTWERYGLPGLGTVILIDPEGNLIEGDETTLAKKLIPQ